MKRILPIALMLLLASCSMLPEPAVSPSPAMTFAPEAPVKTDEPTDAEPPLTDIPEVMKTPEAPVTTDEPTDTKPPLTDMPEVMEAPAATGDFVFDDIIFLGDSTTYGLKAYSMLAGGKGTLNVYTPASGTLTLDHQSYATIVYPPDKSEITIREAAELAKPKAMVITLGVNGVSFMGEDDFKFEYSDLIKTIQTASPDTVIILQSIFPVGAKYEYIKSINNNKITAANEWIKSIAADFGLTYIDTYSKLVGADGFLPDNLQNGDYLHLNSDGFTIEINNIKERLALN
jgi:lysophospholipase L1-like esterase